MDQNQDFFETWVKSQNDFFNTWIESQEKFIKYWAESTSSLQNTFKDSAKSHNFPCADRYFPEYLNWLYPPTAISDEFIKNQLLLKATFQRQMEIFQEMLKHSTVTVGSVDYVAGGEAQQFENVR